MKKNKLWKYLTLGVGTLLMLSIIPEVRVLGLFVDAIGLDILLLTIEGYVVTMFLYLYHAQVKPALIWLNEQFKKIDPYYFIPTRHQVSLCPQLAFHSVPRLICVSTLLLSGALVNA